MPQGDRSLQGRIAAQGRLEFDALFLASALLVIAAAVMGGASRENPLRLAAVELCGVPAAMLAIRRLVMGPTRVSRSAAALLGAIVALPILQSIPLPPSIWGELPDQAARLRALALTGTSEPWLPMTLAPAATRAMGLALIPPVAMFVCTAGMTGAQARGLAWLWMGLAVLGLLLGLAQVASPSGGPAYLYTTTNLASPVGFFANRNHEAGFLLSLIPLAAALGVKPRGRKDVGSGAGSRWLAALFSLLALVTLGVIRSRAGVILAAPAGLAALMIGWRTGPWRWNWRATLAMAGAMAATALVVAAFALTPILDRFTPPAAGEARFNAWPVAMGAARAAQPLGSGLGSFERAFQAVEPLDLVGPTYFNHAHNDYLELWLEAGWIAPVLIGLFGLWLAVAAGGAWRRRDPFGLAAAASIALLMAQSTVDYPLRTETLLVLFAFCCGLLAARDVFRSP